MKKLLCALTVMTTLSGCYLFEAQYVPLTAEQVDLVSSQVGEITKASQESLKASVSAMLGSPVERVEVAGNKLEAILVPGAQEMAEAAGETFVTKALEDPTVKGLGQAFLGAIAAALGIYVKRNGLRGKKQTPPTSSNLADHITVAMPKAPQSTSVTIASGNLSASSGPVHGTMTATAPGMTGTLSTPPGDPTVVSVPSVFSIA